MITRRLCLKGIATRNDRLELQPGGVATKMVSRVVTSSGTRCTPSSPMGFCNPVLGYYRLNGVLEDRCRAITRAERAQSRVLHR
jgi:hypothetical protein